jgi:SET family sugar efflux transporter-like MFS transporter
VRAVVGGGVVWPAVTPARRQADATAGGLVRALVPIGVATALVGLANAFAMPYLALFLRQALHADSVRASLFLFLTPLSAVVVGSAVARYSDRPGRRPRVLAIAALAGVAAYALHAFVRDYWTLLAVSVTLAALAGTLMAQVFAYGREAVAGFSPARATLGINAQRTMLSLAWVGGPPLGAWLIAVYGFQGLFLAAAVAFAATLAALPLLNRTGPTPPGAVAGEAGPPAADVDVSRVDDADGLPSWWTRWGTSTAFAVTQIAGNLTVAVLPLYISHDLHGDVADAGRILGLCAALEIPLMIGLGVLVRRWSLRRMVLGGGIVGALYYALVSVSTQIWQLLALQVLVAGFIACIGGLGISYFQELMPRAPGRATTMYTNAMRVAAMAAGLLFGPVILLGYRLAYVVAALCCAVGVVILILTPVRSRRAPVASEPADGAAAGRAGAPRDPAPVQPLTTVG